jgi:hypothetical protein
MWCFQKPIQAWRPTVANSNQGSVVGQVESLKRRLADAPGLPFIDVLPADLLTEILREHGVDFRERIYSPLVTLSMFLSQCSDADPSQRQAVARLLAQRLAEGKSACSSDTGAYCKARQRLPENVIAELTRQTGERLAAQASQQWRWRGRNVKIVDGSTASMPDTPENQAEYPQSGSQKPGLGFPVLRLLVIFSLAVGSVLDAATGPCKGKKTSELALFRGLYDSLNEGDVLLGDRHFCTYFDIVELQRRSVDVVLRQHQKRITDFRRGVWLGEQDHLVVWTKPARPEWMDEATYQEVPDELVMREARINVRAENPNIRTRTITIATTLYDHEEYPKHELGGLYRLRWQAELNLRSIKTILGMDELRGKTPETVRKELWAHLLTYNLIRKVMAQAAERFEIEPWTISFKATLQTMNAFAMPLLQSTKSRLPGLIEEMLLAISRHRVGDRPDRVEPRALKRRPKPYDLLTKPREHARTLEIRTG